MLDWYQLGFNSLWIGGCALAVAVFSWAYSEATAAGQRLGAYLNQPEMQALIYLSGLLGSLGLTGLGRSPLERLLWALWALLFTGQIILALRDRQ